MGTRSRSLGRPITSAEVPVRKPSSPTHVVSVAVAVLVGLTSCAKSGGSTSEPVPMEPPETARNGAPVFAVPADAEAAINKAGLRVIDASEPRAVQFQVRLHVFIDGHPVTVPAGIGVIDEKRSSALTTRDDSGVVWVEAPRRETYRLGHVFQQWNVRLDKDCIAGFCASTSRSKQLLAFVDGELAADPSTIHLTDGTEIVVWFGDRGTNPSVPSGSPPL
jgi:hypothetical protein